tara:strand:- start:914 stop:1405 length:492 start_codon:yes stop_codon:yes gene_type:complete
MDFALSDEQTAIFDMAKSFGTRHIAPIAQQWDKDGSIPKTLWRDIAEPGFGGLCVCEENGGTGLSRLDATLVFEALSASCASVAAFLSIHNMCAKMIDSYGSDDLKSRILAPAIRMDTLLSYCLTEPGSGSDAESLKTRATHTHDGYHLTYTKSLKAPIRSCV